MKISQFMCKALFDEKSGYYCTRNPIGKDADFITAPEISQVFGELIAAYLLQIFSSQKSRISLVEMGAGRGVLFYDILQTIKKLAKKTSLAADFIASADLHIIEISDVLREIQQERLAEFKIKWHQKFEDFLSQNNRRIFFISNELFDCFPIDQFVKTDIGWCERLIDSGRFITKNFDPKIDRFVQEIAGKSAPFGAILEYSESARNFMKQLCESLQNFGGIAINFDYGYLESDFSNSLQAIKNNQKVGVLENPGNVDISAHVDFGSLDKIAKKFDLKTSLITQREFLLSLGIEERAKILSNQDSAVERLVSTSQMGELFKCHIIWKENE